MSRLMKKMGIKPQLPAGSLFVPFNSAPAPKEEENEKGTDTSKEILNQEEFEALFEQREDGTCWVMGFEFEQCDFAMAKDFYAICKCSGIFLLPRETLNDFMMMYQVDQNLGARLTLALVLESDALGAFMLKENDKRVIGIAKARLNKEKYGVDFDCKLILP